MNSQSFGLASLFTCTALLAGFSGLAQEPPKRKPLPDAVQDAQTPRAVTEKRPEQTKTEHDRADIFAASKAPDVSTALKQQPDEGEIRGFDFSRDPLNAKKPME